MNGETLTKRKKSKDKPGSVISRAQKGQTDQDKHGKATLVRWTQHAHELIYYAAIELRKQSVSSYVTEAALDRAYEDIRRHNRMTAEDEKN